MAARCARMEMLILAFVVYAIWEMTGGFALQPPARAVVAAICIACEALIAVVGLGLVHLH